MNDKKTQTKDKVTGRFFDPTNDAEEFAVDPSGLTGITTDHNNKPTTANLNKDIDPEDATHGISNVQAHNNEVKASDPGEDREPIMNQNIRADDRENQVDLRDTTGNDTLNDATPPNVAGEQSISGSTPDPGSDTDVTKNAQEMGIGLDEDPEHPKPLDLAGDIDKAEEYHRRH